MKSTVICLACLALSVGAAHAQYISPVYRRPIPPAPDACGPGFYLQSNQGMLYYPSHYLRPQFQPVNGIRPGIYAKSPVGGLPGGLPGGVAPPPVKYLYHPQTGLPLPVPAPQFQMPDGAGGMRKQKFVTHPFVRGPRDFFMFGETLDDRSIRQRVPSLIP